MRNLALYVFPVLLLLLVEEASCQHGQISVQSNCGNYTTINSYSGRITSPNHPSKYGNRENCHWLITSYNGSIHLSFENFSTESGYDYVRVYNGSSISSSLLGSFSGNIFPNDLWSLSNQMYITFTSDGSVTRSGFSAVYQGGQGYCVVPRCYNGGTCHDKPSSYYCSCPYGYSGLHCEIGMCIYNSCRNGGTCRSTPSGYNCSCPIGFAGLQCELDICQNYTELSSPDRSRYYHNSTYKCDTEYYKKGWYRFTGAAGSQIATSCVPVNHCGTMVPIWMNGSHPTVAEGIVTRQICYSIWPNNTCCLIHNVKSTIQVVNCGGFYVYELHKPPCDIRYCGENGTVLKNCNESPCLNGGTCQDEYNGYRCRCRQGYSGRRCESAYDNCISRPCYNGGTCYGSNYGYHCNCPFGYSGRQCKTRMSMCNYFRCANGGTCQDTPTGYNCTCPYGYTGQRCKSLAIDACRNYTELSSASRSRYYTRNNYHCDYHNFTKGWYRFIGAAGSQIATSCVPNYRCGTRYPGWMSGSHPTEDDGIVTRRVCYSYNNWRCCVYRNYIRVKNCSTFYIYELDRTPTCDLRYCGDGGGYDYCASWPCYNGGTCQNTPGGYRCSCPYWYSGSQCKISVGCYNNPCRNGGTCHQAYYGHIYCRCPLGYSGQHCETIIKTRVTCDTRYMELELRRVFFPNLDWRNLHLNDPACRVTRVTWSTIRLRTNLGGCGTNHTESNDMLEFRNEVKDDKSHLSQNQSVITRDSITLLRFHCKYSRRQLVSTSFSPSKQTVHVSEENFGNFTFTMTLFKSSSYSNMYLPFEYPVDVTLNQPLWIQFKVTDATTADLAVFADYCRATTSTNPNSFPRYDFVRSGCALDATMVYNYDPTSSVQQLSIKSFRFIFTSNKLVYLHCELLVCHRNSTSSRCSRGCVSSRGRRSAAEFEDTSETYDLSVGPFQGQNSGNRNSKATEDAQQTNAAMATGLGVVGSLLVLVCAVLVVTKLYPWFKIRYSSPDVTVNSYENGSPADFDEKHDACEMQEKT